MFQVRWEDLDALKTATFNMQALRSLRVRTLPIDEGDPEPARDENGQPIPFHAYLHRLNNMLVASRQHFLEQCPLLDEFGLEFELEPPWIPDTLGPLESI